MQAKSDYLWMVNLIESKDFLHKLQITPHHQI